MYVLCTGANYFCAPSTAIKMICMYFRNIDWNCRLQSDNHCMYIFIIIHIAMMMIKEKTSHKFWTINGFIQQNIRSHVVYWYILYGLLTMRFMSNFGWLCDTWWGVAVLISKLYRFHASVPCENIIVKMNTIVNAIKGQTVYIYIWVM